MSNRHSIILYSLFLILVVGALFLIPNSSFTARAFIGPSTGQNPGSGGGLFKVDSNLNIGFGTASPSPASTFNTTSTESGPSGFGYVFMVASTTNPGLALKNLTSGNAYVWSSRNFGNLQLYRESDTLPGYVVMDINQYGDVAIGDKATSTGTGVTARLTVGGNIKTTGSYYGNATNVSGIIASNIGGGAFQSANYAFPLSLAVGTSTTSNLPQTLTVAGGGYFSGSVGIGTTGPGDKLDVAGNIRLTHTSPDLDFMVNGGKYNWRIAAQENVNNALEITPSTAVDGSTFSTPAVTILNTGNVGIGTVSPGGKLQVGTAGTQSAYTYGTGNGDGLLFNFYNDGSPYTRHADIVSSAADASAADIKFFTKAASANPLERVRIDSQGNVGIATTTPGYPLTVAGTIYSTTGGFRFPDATTQTTAYLGSSQTVTAGNVSSGAFGFPSASNAYAFPAALAIGTSTTTGLPANGLFVVGNVGIGTSTPSATLDVQSNHSSAKIAIFKQTHTSNGGAIVIDGPTDDDSRPSELFFNRAGTTKWVVGQEYNVAGFHFRTTAAVGNEKLTILESGNVGIGTTGPRRSLHIDPSTDVTTAFGAPLLQVGGDNSYAANGVFGIGIGYIDATNTISPTEIAYKVINGGAATFGDLIFGTRSVNTNTAPTERMRIQNDGNVGIATTTPGYPLTVAGTIYSTTGGFRFPDATTQTTAYLGSSQTVTAGNVSSGAFGFPSASNAYAFPAALAIGTSTTTGLPANGLFVVGNVGIGTTSPTQTLQVIGAQMGVFNSTTGKGVTINSNLTAGIVDIYSDFLGGSEPKLHLSSYTDRAGANGITIQSGGNVGIGTTGPSSLLHISAATPELRITATTPNTAGQLAFYENETVTWIIDAEKAGGFLNFNTYNGGSTATRVTFLDNGNVGIGTTTPITARLVIVPGAQPAIDVGSQKIIGLGYPAISTDAASVQYVSDAITNAVGGTSTSTGAYVLKSGDTMSGNLNMGGNNISGVNKLYVTTIDPVYQIGGVKYATYVSNTIGQKEEVYGKIKLELGIRNYEYTIDFNKVSVGSDLWLFWQTIAEGKNMKDIQVLLTPQFNGRAWYELKPAQKQIVVFGEPSNLEISKSRNLEISYHLVAPRHDASEWLNQIETNEKGIPLNVK